MKNFRSRTEFFFPQQQIWQVFPAQTPTNWVISLRDKAQKRATWITTANPKQNFQPHFSDWWWGIADVTAPYLMLHHYTDPGLPLAHGCYFYRIATGKLLWEYPTWDYLGQIDEGIVLREKQNIYHLIDRSTGKKLETFASEPTSDMDLWYNSKQAAYASPTIWVEGSDVFEQWKAALITQLSLIPSFQIEQIDHPDYTYLFVYEKLDTNQLQGSLITWPHEGTPGYLLQQPVSGLSTASFFIYRNILAVLEGQQKLLLISLTE